MEDATTARGSLIKTDVNVWPGLVDAISSVLVLMFLLYIMKGVAGGELEAIKARRAMTALAGTIESRFREAGLADVAHSQYTTNILRVTFSDAVLFKRGDYVIPESGRNALRICAEALQSPEAPRFAQIQVEGHTDSTPLTSSTYPHDNWELSSARAVAVLQELIKLGVRTGVISANGYADQVPIDNGHGEAANRKNRRIELRIIYSIPRPGAQTSP
jgi:flagellar motor protein MotB